VADDANSRRSISANDSSKALDGDMLFWGRLTEK